MRYDAFTFYGVVRAALYGIPGPSRHRPSGVARTCLYRGYRQPVFEGDVPIVVSEIEHICAMALVLRVRGHLVKPLPRRRWIHLVAFVSDGVGDSAR